MHTFNTHGPVNPVKHYMVSRARLLGQLLNGIEKGTYFALYAPRQMGKTTLLQQLQAELNRKAGYIPLTFSFEAFENAPVAGFLRAFSKDLGQRLLTVLEGQTVAPAIRNRFAQELPTDYLALRELWADLAQLLPDHRLVLIIDEFDGTPQEAISGLLQTWREVYLRALPPRTLHSIVLLGLQNIARLNLGRSSPFNIAHQVRLPEFSLSQVADLLGQYSAETGQVFAPGVIEKWHEQTGGQPFLVNRLAVIVTEQIATDRTPAITPDNLEQAIQLFVRETNYNFETLTRHGREHSQEILAILFGEPYPFNLNDPLVNTLYMQGVVADNGEGNCRIANPIYAQVLLAALRPQTIGLQGELLTNSYDFRPHATASGLDMGTILTRFREFVERRGKEAFKISPTPQEATGQYLLMAYLEAITRRLGEGAVFSEVPSGDGRLDLIHVYRGARYIIETKIWRGPEKFDQGLEQLERYLRSEGQKVGYYVIFDARTTIYGKPRLEAPEFVRQKNDTRIQVYLVSLGELFAR